MTLLAVPNFSEGRDELTIEAIANAVASRANLLDIHSDASHNRTVYTLAGDAHQLSDALLEGARSAIDHIAIHTHTGAHPHVGALDVAPIVFTDSSDNTERGLAAAAALLTADRLADELDLPVFLYGLLTQDRMTRAAIRRGGPLGLAERLLAGEVVPDFGPPRLHPRAGATLVAARPPLLAFNVELAAPATLSDATRIAARVRQLPGVRAIGVELEGSVPQVSMNLEAPDLTPPAAVLAAIREEAPARAAEIVGLPPARYFDSFPSDIELKNRCMLEERLP